MMACILPLYLVYFLYYHNDSTRISCMLYRHPVHHVQVDDEHDGSDAWRYGEGAPERYGEGSAVAGSVNDRGRSLDRFTSRQHSLSESPSQGPEHTDITRPLLPAPLSTDVAVTPDDAAVGMMSDNTLSYTMAPYNTYRRPVSQQGMRTVIRHYIPCIS